MRGEVADDNDAKNREQNNGQKKKDESVAEPQGAEETAKAKEVGTGKSSANKSETGGVRRGAAKRGVAKKNTAKSTASASGVAKRKAAKPKVTPERAAKGTAAGSKAAAARTHAGAQATVVRKLLKTVEKKLSREDTKASLGDYIRLVQLQKELDDEAPREIKVTWVDHLELEGLGREAEGTGTKGMKQNEQESANEE